MSQQPTAPDILPAAPHARDDSRDQTRRTVGVVGSREDAVVRGETEDVSVRGTATAQGSQPASIRPPVVPAISSQSRRDTLAVNDQAFKTHHDLPPALRQA